MRTTITLEADTEALVRQLMRERGLSFRQAVNAAIRAGLGRGNAAFATPTFRMGSPALSLDKALRVAGEMEDSELLRKLAVRK